MITIARGTTVEVPIRIESDFLVYRPIESVVSLAPLRLRVPAHGALSDWRCAVSGAVGIEQVNAKGNPPKDNEMRPVIVIDDDTVEFNPLNASEWSAYCGGGHLVYREPHDLTQYASAALHVRDPQTLQTIGIYPLDLDTAVQTAWLQMTPAESAAVTYDAGVAAVRGTRTSGQVDALGDWVEQVSITN